MLIALLNILVVLCSLILILLVLIQRGKGGGLAGAFGGAGGSSAFGTKAGDVFTKVTMYVAGIWIVLSMLLVILINRSGPASAWGNDPAAASTATQKVPTTPGTSTKPKTDGAAAPAIGEAPAGTAPAPAAKTPEGPARPINPGDPIPILPPPIPPQETPKS